MKDYFHLPDKTTRKGKSATIICMIVIIVSLYTASYLLFLRTVDVDVTKDASITYSGETGTASVKVKNEMKAYNQRIQEFMDSITYEVTPQNGIANGDTITIKASYDAELARRYNINPVNINRKVNVKKLPVRFESAEEIPDAYLKTIARQGETYLKNNIDTILSEDFTTFTVESEPDLKRYQLVYRTFLDSKQGDSKDKIIDVYRIIATGEAKVSEDEDVLEKKEETIYYMVTNNEINTSLKILDENVYGEKMIMGSGYDMNNQEDFMRYMSTKYGDTYELTLLDTAKK